MSSNRIKQLEEEVSSLRRALGAMEARIANLPQALPAKELESGRPRSRRDAIRLGALAAVGAGGALALRSLPAQAVTGGNLLLGKTNDADAATSLVYTSASAPLPQFQVFAGTSISLPSSQQGFHGSTISVGPSGNDGVDGYAAGSLGYGVLGQSDAGYGVVGATDTGVDLAAIGTGRFQQRPVATPGPGQPPSYTPAAGRFELVRDLNGVLWASQQDGSWRRHSAVVTFPNPRRCFGDGTLYPVDAVITNIDAKSIIPSKGGGSTGVPVGAPSAWCAVMAYQPGVMTLYPAGTTDPGIGNWACQGTSSGTGVQMMYMFVPLSSTGFFNLHNNFTAKQIFVDVWGYLF
jgi:hypothetical protein